MYIKTKQHIVNLKCIQFKRKICLYELAENKTRNTYATGKNDLILFHKKIFFGMVNMS